MRTALTLAGAALLLGGLVGCGGSDSGGSDDAGMPTGATTEEFCGNFSDLQTSLSTMDPTSAPSDAIGALQDAADNMAATGTPDDISDEERSGLEATITAIQGLGDDATMDDITNLESTLSDTEKSDAEAFDAYLKKTCPELG